MGEPSTTAIRPEDDVVQVSDIYVHEIQESGYSREQAYASPESNGPPYPGYRVYTFRHRSPLVYYIALIVDSEYSPSLSLCIYQPPIFHPRPSPSSDAIANPPVGDPILNVFQIFPSVSKIQSPSFQRYAHSTEGPPSFLLFLVTCVIHHDTMPPLPRILSPSSSFSRVVTAYATRFRNGAWIV